MEAVKGAGQRRRYHSPVRQEGARRTRRAIVIAAADLFPRHGYEATSLADIADSAGVARPTVISAFGSKPGLLRAVLDQALAGDDEPVPVADRAWFQPVWAAQTQADVLDAYAGVCALIGSRAALMFEVVRRAADSSPEAAALWETLLDNRHAGAEMVLARMQSVGPRLSPELEAAATDTLWILNDPAHFDALVHRRGWDEATFTSWLSGQMRHGLLID